MEKIGFILKVFVLSAMISVLIKLLAPYVEINPSALLAIGMVLTPSVILGIVLGQRFLQSQL
ncbi:MAG: hypothetical protein BRC33_06440 [Cyanobacteria bacterium SW_9_44_58]|nr:MAG: hypothetical protein BRC33_06440 [Cyanobacteria bacterium SW_9_44_58]